MPNETIGQTPNDFSDKRDFYNPINIKLDLSKITGVFRDSLIRYVIDNDID